MVFGPLNIELAPGALSGIGSIPTPGAYANPDGSIMTVDQMRGDQGGDDERSGDTDRRDTTLLGLHKIRLMRRIGAKTLSRLCVG